MKSGAAFSAPGSGSHRKNLFDDLSPTRSISPHHRIVQFNANSPQVHNYAAQDVSSSPLSPNSSDNLLPPTLSDSAILTDDEDEDQEPRSLAEAIQEEGYPTFKVPQYTQRSTEIATLICTDNQEFLNLNSQNMMQSDSDGLSLPFNKRPLSDTPILSANDSPNSQAALSPLVLSESEEDEEEELGGNTNNDGMNSDSQTRKAREEERRIRELTQSNTQHNKIMSVISDDEEDNQEQDSTVIPPPTFKATLDIPGQTKSKQSPEGKIVNTSERVVVVMIGLPARGKSYLSNKLVRYLNWLQINARLFNVGATRRKRAAHVGPEHSPLPDIPEGTKSPKTNSNSNSGTNLAALTKVTSHDANFFSPDNKSSIKLREEWAKETLDNLLDYLLEGDGCVGVFDATNSTKARRKMVFDTIQKRSQGQLKVLFLESICTDESIIDDNIHLKLSGPDYKDMDPQDALNDFVGRLKNYEKAYETIDEEEEKIKDFQYIKMIDVGRKVIAFNIKGFLASQIIYYFLNFNLYERQIWITRHGESTDNVKGLIGGDAPLTKRGIKFSKALAKFMLFKKKEFREEQLKAFENKIMQINRSKANNEGLTNRSRQPPEEPSSSVWTSMMKRSIETAKYLPEEEFDIKQMRMLDELGAGKFDGMSYQEIQSKYPLEFQARLENKMTYRYPGSGGESYLDVINRLKPVITEVERTTNHILIITHRVVSRVLLGYFLNLNKETIGELDVPLHTLYLFEPNPFGVEWHMYEYDEATDWFKEVNPESLENSKKVKQVGITFRERKYSVVPTAPRRQSSVGSNGSARPSFLISGGSSSSSSSSISSGSNQHIRKSNTNTRDELQRARGILRSGMHNANQAHGGASGASRGMNIEMFKKAGSSNNNTTHREGLEVDKLDEKLERLKMNK